MRKKSANQNYITCKRINIIDDIWEFQSDYASICSGALMFGSGFFVHIRNEQYLRKRKGRWINEYFRDYAEAPEDQGRAWGPISCWRQQNMEGSPIPHLM
jgi:hypothetical protein